MSSAEVWSNVFHHSICLIYVFAYFVAVTRHQNNYTRILQLRHEAELLDSKIKSSVQLLGDVRKELLAIPLDSPKETARPVPYKDLLAYAKNIAPFTIPPTFRPKPTTAEGEKPAVSQDRIAESNEQAIANTPAADGTAEAVPPTHPEEDTNRTLNALSVEHKQWIADLSNLPFLPWPNDNDMAAGALHQLNYQTMHGNDPTDVTRILADEEEDRRLAAEQEDSMRSDENYVSRQSGGSAARPADVPPKPKARFGLEDSDDEDGF
jgi:hypothetical protein